MTHSDLGPLTSINKMPTDLSLGKYDGGIFSVQFSSYKMTGGYENLTQNQPTQLSCVDGGISQDLIFGRGATHRQQMTNERESVFSSKRKVV